MPAEETKKVKVTLVSPPPPSPLAFVDYQNPLIGLAYLAAVLEKNRCEVTVIDSPALHMTYKNVEEEIGRLEPDMVGITSVTATYASALKVAQIVKEAYPPALVVVGGPHVTISDDQTVIEHPEVDVVVRGEGEQTIAELARYVSGTLSMNKIAGITFKKDGDVIQNPERSCIENLDELPYPAYNYFPLTKYRIFGKLGLPMVTSRGCPFQCAFCLVPRIAGNRIRARTPQNVVNELEWLRDKYHPDFISFNDEVFTYDARRVLDICSEIRSRNIKLPWDCQTRVDLVSKELLYRMRGANCQLISFGVESGSQEILNAMKKGTTVQQNATAIRWAKEAGLSVTASLIIGYPGENKKTMQQTVDFIKKTEPDDIYLFLATPYPSTELRDTVIDLGWKMSRDWNDYEMQTATFENVGLSFEKINSIRETFYNQLYSPSYILKQSLKKTIYSRIMLQNGLHQLLWRIKLPWLSANFKKLLHM